MSLGTPTETNSSIDSIGFNEISFHELNNEYRSRTPLPTADSNAIIGSISNEWPSPILTFPSDDIERPTTSTSSMFSFTIENEKTPPPAASLRLPAIIAPRNPGFFESLAASDTMLYAHFNNWLENCSPNGESFATVSAEELEKNPRDIRSEPELPSLFKRREYGCGYCRSVGFTRWETHTRQKCEQLHALAPCKICGAHGEMNHTETYCPMKPPVNLPLTDRFVQESETRSFQRIRNHFHKHSWLFHRIYPFSDNFI